MDFNEKFTEFLSERPKEEENASHNVPTGEDKPRVEKPFTPKQWSKRDKPVNPLESKGVPQTTEIHDIKFEDIPITPTSTFFFTASPYKPKRQISMMTNPKYHSLEERKEALLAYFRHIESLKRKIYSIHIAFPPLPKPILPSEKCVNSLFTGQNNDKNESQETTNVFSDNLYVSRSGRKVKRKLYSEDIENDLDFEEQENTIFAKKTKPKVLNKTVLTQLSSDENDNSLNIVKSKVKKYGPNLGLNASRSDILFNNLIKSNESKQKEEEAQAAFEKSLITDNYSIDDFDEDVIPSSQTTENDIASDSDSTKNLAGSPVIHERIVPPIPKYFKKKCHNKASTSAMKTNLVAPPTSNSSASNSQEGENMNCPICDKIFSLSKIEDHAANCGLEEEPQKQPGSSRSQQLDPSLELKDPSVSIELAPKQICKSCSKEFHSPYQFKKHMEECVATMVHNL